MSETMTGYSKAPEKMKKYEDQQITSPITNRTRSLTYSLESKFRQPSFPLSLQTPRLPFITAFENKQHHNDTRRDNGRQQVFFVFSYLSDSDSVTDQGLSYFCLSNPGQSRNCSNVLPPQSQILLFVNLTFCILPMRNHGICKRRRPLAVWHPLAI